jgi:pimeloyl-ACP methyl ester carboxylesterase
MSRTIKQAALFLTLAFMMVLAIPAGAFAQTSVNTLPGTLPDGATFLIQVPTPWNGILFLYSHGYVVPGALNPAEDVGDPATGAFLLANGFALAGSSYATTGWAIQEALVDQIAVLDIFDQAIGQPRKTIAWGHSLGGMITAGLIQRNPRRFDAALPMCGVLSGGVATWNTALDAELAFSTLIAPGSGLELVNITNPTANFELAEQILAGAQQTAAGRARIALGAALGNTPGWFETGSPEPASTDYASQEENQFLWDANVDFPFVFAFRAELEARAGGNVSWTTGVDFQDQLNRSLDRDEVRALYKEAGLDLHKDLDALNHAARIKANPEAVEYLEKNIIYNGRIHIPVLTLHTKGDGLVVVENESAYKDVVEDAGNEEFLRRNFVDRAGHCAFSPAETIAAAEKLLDRLETGRWHDRQPEELNAIAAALGPTFNVVATQQGNIIPAAPAFIELRPGPYLRPFDAFDRECEFGFGCH